MISNTDEYLTKCVVDMQLKKFHLYSNEGRQKTVECANIDEFMNVLEVVRENVADDALCYTDLN